MRIYKFISFIVIGLLITVLFGYIVSIPTPAQSDAMQFSTKESASNAYYYRAAYDVNDSYVGSNINIVGVNVVSKASVVGAPAVCAQAANSIDLFIDGTDGALWWEHWDGQTWGTWKSLGGSLTSDPANNAINAPITKTITLTFNQKIQAGAKYSTITLKKGAVKVSATMTITGTTLTIKPSAALSYNTAYTLTIPRDAVKNGTTTITTPITSTFTTVKS